MTKVEILTFDLSTDPEEFLICSDNKYMNEKINEFIKDKEVIDIKFSEYEMPNYYNWDEDNEIKNYRTNVVVLYKSL